MSSGGDCRRARNDTCSLRSGTSACLGDRPSLGIRLEPQRGTSHVSKRVVPPFSSLFGALDWTNYIPSARVRNTRRVSQDFGDLDSDSDDSHNAAAIDRITVLDTASKTVSEQNQRRRAPVGVRRYAAPLREGFVGQPVVGVRPTRAVEQRRERGRQTDEGFEKFANFS